jgi:hypothetical protein
MFTLMIMHLKFRIRKKKTANKIIKTAKYGNSTIKFFVLTIDLK